MYNIQSHLLNSSKNYTLHSSRVNVPKANGHLIGLHCDCNISIIFHHKIIIFISRERRQNSASAHIKKIFVAIRIVE